METKSVFFLPCCGPSRLHADHFLNSLLSAKLGWNRQLELTKIWFEAFQIADKELCTRKSRMSIKGPKHRLSSSEFWNAEQEVSWIQTVHKYGQKGDYLIFFLSSFSRNWYWRNVVYNSRGNKQPASWLTTDRPDLYKFVHSLLKASLQASMTPQTMETNSIV